MDKELTPLEALINLFKYACNYKVDENHRLGNSKEWKDIIKTALKEYELMKQTKFIVADKKISDDDLEKLKNQGMFVGNLEACEIKPLFDEETKRKLKALEVIKERLDIGIVILGDEPKLRITFQNMLRFYDITQEEFELLKEVLKND